MSKVGIIANPDAGKDIRRVVSYARLSGNREKADLIRRLILGIDSTGVDEVLIMPDYCGLGMQALAGLDGITLRTSASVLAMRTFDTQEDSTAAARIMSRLGIGCIVTIGGDGTNRVVAKGDCTTPLIALSTGTNNVFPVMMEATVAGMAAGIVAQRAVDLGKVTTVQKRIVISDDNGERDMALVDVVVLDQQFIGARAVWQVSDIREIICTRATPDTIGLSSIGGSIEATGPEEDFGLYLEMGKGDRTVRAAVMPGVVEEIAVKEYRKIKLGEEVVLQGGPCLVALDGEREIFIKADEKIKAMVERTGPRVVDISKTLSEASKRGFFIIRNQGLS